MMLFQDLDRIVFAGDSVTDMGSAQPVGEGLFDNLGQGYVRMIDNLLAAWYPQLRLRITNSGISGNTSADLMARYQRDVLNLHPQWVSVCIGINDVWRQFDSPALTDCQVLPEAYEANLRKPNQQDPMRARMDEYGAICQNLASRYGCPFIDLQAMFTAYFQHRHSSFIAWDRIHPNEIGATLIALEFLKACGIAVPSIS